MAEKKKSVKIRASNSPQTIISCSVSKDSCHLTTKLCNCSHNRLGASWKKTIRGNVPNISSPVLGNLELSPKKFCSPVIADQSSDDSLPFWVNRFVIAWLRKNHQGCNREVWAIFAPIKLPIKVPWKRFKSE